MAPCAVEPPRRGMSGLLEAMPVGARLGYGGSCRSRDMVPPWHTAGMSSYPSTLLEPRLTGAASQARAWKRECACAALRCAGVHATRLASPLTFWSRATPLVMLPVVMRLLCRPVAQREVRCSKVYNGFNNKRNDTHFGREMIAVYSRFGLLEAAGQWRPPLPSYVPCSALQGNKLVQLSSHDTQDWDDERQFAGLLRQI